jgi:hypothetical protein
LGNEIEHSAAMATTALQCKPDGDTTSENGRRQRVDAQPYRSPSK